MDEGGRRRPIAPATSCPSTRSSPTAFAPSAACPARRASPKARTSGAAAGAAPIRRSAASISAFPPSRRTGAAYERSPPRRSGGTAPSTPTNGCARPPMPASRPPATPLLVPLALFLAEPERFVGYDGPLGVEVSAGEAVQPLEPYLWRLAMVALAFPKFSDGRSYSAARLLRERLGYKGELRADRRRAGRPDPADAPLRHPELRGPPRPDARRARGAPARRDAPFLPAHPEPAGSAGRHAALAAPAYGLTCLKWTEHPDRI